MIERLPEDAQTLYAELTTRLLTREASRSLSQLAGTFTSKTVKGTEYLYFQYSEPGGHKRQVSVGRRTDTLDAIVDSHRASSNERAEDAREIARLASLLRAAGVSMTPHGPARVLRALTDAGMFRVGSILVGSYAFQAIGNQLGVTWPSAAWRTQDVDIAAHLDVAVPHLEVDVPKALDSLSMGFLPVPQLDPRKPSTSFTVRRQSLRVDLITPGSETDDAPIYIPRLRAAAAPLKYLSLVMRDAGPAPIVESSSATLVVVPDPARFALHKLLVSGRRSIQQQTKSGKDLHQAALLIEVLAEDRPQDLEEAARSFAESGPAVTKRIQRALATLVKRHAGSTAGADVVTDVLRRVD